MRRYECEKTAGAMHTEEVLVYARLLLDTPIKRNFIYTRINSNSNLIINHSQRQTPLPLTPTPTYLHAAW